MKHENIRLVQPSVQLRREFICMTTEYLAAGEKEGGWLFERALDDFPAYVRRLLDYAEGKNLPEGWVPSSTYWLIRNGSTVLGHSSLRHCLTPALEQRGGHIGYYIRPSERGKGYGSAILTLSLDKARQLGLKRVLVTCGDENRVSARIIEKNGGKLTDKVKVEGIKHLTRRYWIDL